MLNSSAMPSARYASAVSPAVRKGITASDFSTTLPDRRSFIQAPPPARATATAAPATPRIQRRLRARTAARRDPVLRVDPLTAEGVLTLSSAVNNSLADAGRRAASFSRQR